MLLPKINRQSPEPIYRQIVRQVQLLIENDALEPGAVLPSTRELAQMLGVSRFTAAQAYDELWAKGYTESRQGSYTHVRSRPKLVKHSGRDERGPQPELKVSSAAEQLAARKARAVLPTKGIKGQIDFSSMQVDSRLFPVDAMRCCFARVLRRSNAALLNYAEPAGYYPLRQFIASRMQRHGTSLAAENIIITHGSMQGLALTLQLLVNPGDTVAIEQPTFPGAIAIVGLHGARALGIPMRSDGVNLEVLSKRLTRARQRRPSLLYTIPTFHNPTGVTTAQPHREQLLGLCERQGIPIVEDGFQEEFTFFDRVVHPIKSMDHKGVVFYLGTFSKVFAPGLRIGWIAARRECIHRLSLLKYASDISCSPIVQAALHRYCETGAYELHLRRMNRVFAARLDRAQQALEAELPRDRVSFQSPSGGYLIWLRFQDTRATEQQVLDALARHGVAATPSSVFYSGQPSGFGLRLSISSLDADEIAEGARRLGKAIRAL